MGLVRVGATVLIVAGLALQTRPAKAEVKYFDVHRTLGTIARGTFAGALVIGAASKNLGNLTDPAWRGKDVIVL